MTRLTTVARSLAPTLLLAPVLAGCGEKQEPTYEAGATDKSGGELIVNDADQPGVKVDVPDTAMTNVPADAASSAPAADGASGETTPPNNVTLQMGTPARAERR